MGSRRRHLPCLHLLGIALRALARRRGEHPRRRCSRSSRRARCCSIPARACSSRRLSPSRSRSRSRSTPRSTSSIAFRLEERAPRSRSRQRARSPLAHGPSHRPGRYSHHDRAGAGPGRNDAVGPAVAAPVRPALVRLPVCLAARAARHPAGGRCALPKKFPLRGAAA